MGYLGYQLAATGMLVFYLAISWITSGLLNLQGTTLWVVRSLLSALGFGLYGLGWWWWSRREQRKSSTAAVSAQAAATPEIDYLIREAEARLRTSHLGRNARLRNLPAVFVIGGSGAAKTSTVLNSGVEPELLAGHVYQDNLVATTRTANFWFTRRAVLVEAGGGLLEDAAAWRRLVRRLTPDGVRTLFSRRQSPGRAAIVCFDCEQFLQPSAAESITIAARALQARLAEIAQIYGTALPVYALFTRMDRIAWFPDWAANFTNQEVAQVLGVTVPIRTHEAGVYADEQTSRLSAAFDCLFRSLCDKRPGLLSLEHDPKKQPGVYEFPRELRKLRGLAVQFLVDLCRPSHLRASPFLRGFYFSGVRPVSIREEAPALRNAEPAGVSGGSASGIFDQRRFQPVASPAPAQAGGFRQVPQWVFLSRFFSEVVLEDRVTQGRSVRSDLLRRALLTGGTAIGLAAALLFTVSYARNHALESQVLEAARGITYEAAAQDVPSLDSLERLETLRVALATLTRYRLEGPPWPMRWGLYVGDDLYPGVRGAYYRRFHQLLFGSTQAGLLNWLRQLPPAPGPNDEYAPTYDTLKAYLITTSHHEKSTRMFLSPVLSNRWAAKRTVDGRRMRLVQAQFDFYSEDLKIANPYSPENDGMAIQRARRYLAQFGALDRIYQFMLAEASRKNPPVNFNRQFPGSGAYVINNRDIAGAYSKEGWAFMQEAFRHADRYYEGEEWVLGSSASTVSDRAKLEQDLQQLYRKDFYGRWRQYLANSAVAHYASLDDAARKLNQLSGNQSYLMALFCVASGHTSAASEELRTAFQPVQYVEPPGCTDRYLNASNQPYMNVLVSLGTSIEQAARSARGPNDPAVAQTLAEAANARKVTRLVAQNFRVDREGRVEQMVQKLMEDPITHAEALLGALGPAQLNAEGKRFCAEFLELTNKYPFNSASRIDATLAELSGILRPVDGRLWAFYDGSLKNQLVRQGDEYVVKAGSEIRITPAFAAFFNRAARFSRALYGEAGREPRLAYTMRALPAQGVTSVTLSLDGQVLKSAGKGGDAKQFVWPGSATQGAILAGSLGGPDLGFIRHDGLWGAFRFFADADRFQQAGTVYSLQWVPRQGQSGQPMTLSGGQPLELPFALDLAGAPPIFQKGYLAGFQCVSVVAQ
jgi:type VI secretion system protein ImpL